MNRKLALRSAAFLGLATMVAGCGNNALPNLNPSVGSNNQGSQVSQERLNAARRIDNAVTFRVDVVQLPFPLIGPFSPCDPLGVLPGNLPWPSRIGGPVDVTVNFAFEYSYLRTVNDTDYILSIRSGADPNAAFFSQLEFNFRAVNPRVIGHPPGADYTPLQARFPSNDKISVENRSLINMVGGDVAVVVLGVKFNTLNPPNTFNNTLAYEHFLGPRAWLLFLRDNAFQSGRFYAIQGSFKGAPRAGQTQYDIPPPQPPLGAFQSVQLNGDQFDLLSQPVRITPPYTACDGVPAPGSHYAFFDRSNVDRFGAPAPGFGGFVFVIRRSAFVGRQLVLNPNSPNPMLLPDGDFGPLNSGYDEAFIPDIFPKQPAPFVAGPPGVHELGLSVFFIHTFNPPGP